MAERITTKQAAKLAGVSTSTISAWASNQHIKADVVFQGAGRVMLVNADSLREHMAARSKSSKTQAGRYETATRPEGLIDSKEIAAETGIPVDTVRNRLVNLRRLAQVSCTKGTNVYSRTWFYTPDAADAVRDYKKSKPVDHVSHAVRKYGAEGALRVARERERAMLDMIPTWKREIVPGPREGAACPCGYSGHGLFDTGKGWRCWTCVTDKR